jgi:hypothetical protein
MTSSTHLKIACLAQGKIRLKTVAAAGHAVVSAFAHTFDRLPHSGRKQPPAAYGALGGFSFCPVKGHAAR